MPNKKDLRLIGLMLYAGEGAKTNSNVDFINTNSLLVKAFVLYLRKCCQIDENRLKFYLYCFEDQDVSNIINFWCSELNAKPEQFTKPYIRPVRANKRGRISPHGVIHVRYSDKRLLSKILKEINDTLIKYG